MFSHSILSCGATGTALPQPPTWDAWLRSFKKHPPVYPPTASGPARNWRSADPVQIQTTITGVGTRVSGCKHSSSRNPNAFRITSKGISPQHPAAAKSIPLSYHTRTRAISSRRESDLREQKESWRSWRGFNYTALYKAKSLQHTCKAWNSHPADLHISPTCSG